MMVQIFSDTLSDNSKVFAVGVKTDDGHTISIAAVDEDHANQLSQALSKSVLIEVIDGAL